MSKLKWGFSTLGAPEMTMEELILLAKKHHIQFIEVRTVENRTDLPTLFDEKYKKPNLLKALLKKSDVKIIGLNSGFKLLVNDQKSRNDLLSFARWAQYLNVPYIRIFGGLDYGTTLNEKDYNSANETLDWWSREKQLRGFSCDLLLETHDVFSDSDGIINLLDRLKYPLNLIWDSHHTFRLAGEEFEYSWDKLKEYIKHIHVKDSNSIPYKKYNHTYTMPGDGELEIKKLLTMLKREKYQGVVSLEWELAWHQYLPSLDSAITRAKEIGWI